MNTSIRNVIIAIALVLSIIWATSSHAQTTWESGVSCAWTVQGGLSALPYISGASINPGSTARVYDSGGTVYQFRAVFSGTTVNNSPYRISPTSLQAGGAGSGVSMWELQGISGDTLWARTLAVDGTVKFYGSGVTLYKNSGASLWFGTGGAAQWIGADGEIWMRDNAGNNTVQTPHNKDGDWVFNSTNDKTKNSVFINMMDFIKDFEKVTGKRYIFRNELEYKAYKDK